MGSLSLKKALGVRPNGFLFELVCLRSGEWIVSFSMIKSLPEMLGRYQLLALLATGGMAEIYLARQTGIQGFNRLVVVKRVHPHLARDANFLEMFFDEARIAAQLNHPNIVQIFDLGNEGEQYFIAMEYLEGESLAYLVSEAQRTGKVMPHEIASGIVLQICDGLGYAHNLCDEKDAPMHIVHRDVNPQNVIVMFSGQVKLVDFGIAKAVSQEHHTTVGTLKGKISYMSPEQCRCEPLSASSDVFSLGVCFWELLTHERLFKRQNEVETINAILNDDIPQVRRLRPEIPAELETIVERALSRDPTKRFANAADMDAALRRVVRTLGEEVGKQEIAVFVEQVFGDRARTKHRLLDEIRRSDSDQVTLGLLKPDTKESIPGTATTSDSIPKEVLSAPTIIASDSGSFSKPLTVPRRFPAAVWYVIPAVLLTAITMWWLMSGRSSDQSTATVPETKPMTIEERPQPKRAALPATPDTVGSTGLAAARNAPSDAGVATATVVRAEPRKAELSVTSTPSGCKVTVDGVEMAITSPIERFSVEPKVDHTVDVLCSKYQKETKKFKVGVGEHVTLEFSPMPIPPPPIAATGRLRLNTDPWSEVYLSNKKLGVTPLDIKLPLGKHTLTLVNSENGARKTVPITIDAGKASDLYFEFK